MDWIATRFRLRRPGRRLKSSPAMTAQKVRVTYPRPENLHYYALTSSTRRALSRGVCDGGTGCGARGSRSQRDTRAAAEPPPGATRSPRRKPAVVGSALSAYLSAVALRLSVVRVTRDQRSGARCRDDAANEHALGAVWRVFYALSLRCFSACGAPRGARRGPSRIADTIGLRLSARHPLRGEPPLPSRAAPGERHSCAHCDAHNGRKETHETHRRMGGQKRAGAGLAFRRRPDLPVGSVRRSCLPAGESLPRRRARLWGSHGRLARSVRRGAARAARLRGDRMADRDGARTARLSALRKKGAGWR